MRRFREQPKFEIQPSIEQKPFESPAVQSFFAKWCEINDSIQPQTIDRDEWEKRGIEGVLEKRPDGKQTLFIPEDLQLWEMVGVMEKVDHDTFMAKPERRTEAKEKLLKLAETFKNAGSYIAQRLEGITEGQEIAKALALEFYEYGQSLAQGKRSEEALDINDVASKDLVPEEIETVDRFLAGDALYELRQKRAEQAAEIDPSKKDELYEVERRKTLAQFFRVAEKSFMLEGKGVDGELQENAPQRKNWQSNLPVHGAFLAKIEKAMTQKIEIPRREFEMAIFRRGLEKLTSEMKKRDWKQAVNSFFEKIGFDLRIKQEKLFNSLDIPGLKADLEAVRQTGDLEKISQREREITDKIQDAVSSFPYRSEGDNPSEMLSTQYINCVGASTLGGALMKEAGLNYLVGTVPGHSMLFLVTSNGQVELRDMRNSSLNDSLTDEIIDGRKKDSTSISVQDIVDFSRNPDPKGLAFDIKQGEEYKKKLSLIKKDRRIPFVVFEPDYGQQLQILNNTAYAFNKLGRHEEAVEAYRQATALDPKDAVLYTNLGGALHSLGRHEESIEVYRQALAVDQKYAQAHNGLGLALYFVGRYEEAIESYRQAIIIDPRGAALYINLGNALRSLGRNKEAIESYQKFINLSKKKKDAHFRKRIKKIIKELEER